MSGFIQLVFKFKWWIITFVVLITLLLANQIRFIQINSDIFSSLPDDDPVAMSYQEIGKDFNGNDIGMIVLESEDVFTSEVLEHIRQITDSLSLMEGISTVTSLSNILDIKSTEWGIEIGTLVDEYDLPHSKAALDSLKSYVMGKDLYKGNIVSTDGSATLVLFVLYPEADKQALAQSIKSSVEDMQLPEEVYFGGLLFMLNDISELILADMFWLIPIVFVVILLILLLSFRSLSGMFLPMITAAISVIWTLGIMQLLGFEISIISNFVPVVLLSLGSAYTIHALNAFKARGDQDRQEALGQAMKETTLPIILAALTTATGFVAFIFGAYLGIIRDFGIVTAIGIVIALFLSIVFIPALINAFSALGNRRKKQNKVAKKDAIDRLILDPIIRLLESRSEIVLSLWGIILLLSVAGIFKVKTSVNISDYFANDNPTRISENIMQEKFGGSMPVFVIFEGDLQDPGLLKMMKKTTEFMEEDPNIASAQSVADLVAQMNEAMGEGLKIPDERDKIEQLWFLLEGQDIMNQLVTEDLNKGVIQTKFASIETEAIESFTKKMEDFVKANSSEDYQLKFTGVPPLYVKLNQSLVKSQYSSLIIAILLILLIVGFIMRSILKGFYATIPILATIIVLMGIMGFADIPLDIATVLVGSIALGIGIDYSIHLMTGFNQNMKKYGEVSLALKETIRKRGRAIVINIFAVAAGFILLQFAQIVPMQNFGLLIAISMIGSGFGALTLLPLLLNFTYRKKINHNLKSH